MAFGPDGCSGKRGDKLLVHGLSGAGYICLALPRLKYKPGVIGYLDSAIRPKNPLLNKNYLNFEIKVKE